MFTGLRKLLDDEEQGLVGKLLLGTGVTVGGIISFELIEFAKANPLATLAVVKAFGAEFVLAVIMTLLVNRLIGVMQVSACSNQEMADAIRRIADKDERVGQRLELLSQYNAQNAREQSEALSAIAKRMEAHEQNSNLVNSALDRIEKRQVNIYNHNQRTASVTPFRDPFDLSEAEQEGI